METENSGARPLDFEGQTILRVIKQCLRKRKRLILVCLFVVLIPIVIYNEQVSPVYEANALFVFESFASPMAGYERDLSDAVVMSNQMEEIQSYAFALEIVKALSDEMVDLLPGPGENSKLDRTSYAASVIQDDMFAIPVKKSNIISISFRSNDAALTQVVVNTALEVLEKRNLEIKQKGVGGVKKFIEGQLAQYKSQLNAAEERLKTYRIENNITVLKKEAEEILRRITDAEAMHNNVVAEKQATEDRLVALEANMKEQKDILIPSITDVGSIWAQELKKKLLNLNLSYMELKVQGYDSEHPKMVSLKKDIDKIESDLTEQAKMMVEGKGLIDPVEQIQKSLDEIITLQVELVSIQAREKVLQEVLDRYNEQLKSLPDKEFMLTRLIRERDSNQNTYMMLQQKLEEASVSEAENISDIRIIDLARLPLSPVIPLKGINLAIGVLLGLFVGLVVAFVIESRNLGIHSAKQLEKMSGWQVVASIPQFDTLPKGKSSKISGSKLGVGSRNGQFLRAMAYHLEPQGGAAEAFRILKTNLEFLGVGTEYKNLLITSLAPGDGKSMMVANLAMAFSEFGKSTVIVDSDMKRPVVHSIFKREKSPGLTDLLEIIRLEMKRGGKQNIITEERVARGLQTEVDNILELNPKGVRTKQETFVARRQTRTQWTPMAENYFRHVVAGTNIDNLSAITSGEASVSQHQNLISEYMPSLLERLEKGYELVMIDAPPLLLTSESQVLASMVDAVLLVIPADTCDREMLDRAAELLKTANANVIGTVLNKVELQGKYKGYYKYHEV